MQEAFQWARALQGIPPVFRRVFRHITADWAGCLSLEGVAKSGLGSQGWTTVYTDRSESPDFVTLVNPNAMFRSRFLVLTLDRFAQAPASRWRRARIRRLC